jgi:mycothiol synthase
MSVVALRAPRPDEAEAVVELSNEYARRLWGTDDMTLEEVNATWSAPGADVERDAVVAVGSGGELVGYGVLYDVAHNHEQFWLFVRAEEQAVDVARSLLERLEARARETAASGAVLRTSAAAHELDRVRLLEDVLGYRRVRHAFRMEIELDDAIAEPAWPEGIAVRTYDPDADAEATYEADMAAFADHWGFERESFAEWVHWTHLEPFDPELCFLAEEGGEIVGFSMCPPHKEGEPDLAWVGNLGVRPAWRRQGLGLALLLHSLRVFRARGFRHAGLGVDGENTTGAVRLYERAGMHVARQWNNYEKAVDG